MKRLTLISIFALSIMVTLPTLAQDLLKGLRARDRGDYETALRELTGRADNKSMDGFLAQYALGYMYYDGVGVEQDYVKAAEWFRGPAKAGAGKAQTMLGTMFSEGKGVVQDYAEAARWFRKAATPGQFLEAEAWANFNLGTMYVNGKGVRHDYVEAAKHYRLSAERGFPSAQQNLGILYALGNGVPLDHVEAHKWHNLAAANDVTGAAKSRDLLESRMTPAQIAEAQKLAREWMEKHKK